MLELWDWGEKKKLSKAFAFLSHMSKVRTLVSSQCYLFKSQNKTAVNTIWVAKVLEEYFFFSKKFRLEVVSPPILFFYLHTLKVKNKTTELNDKILKKGLSLNRKDSN